MISTDDTFGKVMSAALLGLMGWTAFATQTNTVALASQSAQIHSIEAQISAVGLDRYTASDAEKDLKLIEQRLARMEQWGQNLSERVRRVEGQRNE